MRLRRGIPVMAALDLQRTLSFYQQLGFAEVFMGPASMAVKRDDIEIHFWKCDDPEIPRHTSCRIEVEGIDALHAELEPHGILHPNGPLGDRPWGFREFAALDCDGNLLTFVERLAR